MNSIEATLKIILVVLLACAVGCIMIYLPPHADEFSKYQRLACFTFDGSVFSTLQNGCDKYPASFLGFQFHKNYDYYGVTSNFLYAPLYFLFPNIYSHYLFGFISLMIFSGLMTKALNLKLSAGIIPPLFFPILYSFIHDIGPIILAMMSYPIFIIAISKLFNSQQTLKNFALWLLAAFLVTLLAVEDKAFFIYLLPQIFIISIALSIYLDYGFNSTYEFFKAKISGLIFIKLALFNFAIMVALASILFLIQIDGMTYFHHLKELRIIAMREQPIARWDIFFSIFNFMVTPILVVHRTIVSTEFSLIASRLLFIPLLVGLALYLWRCKHASLWLIFFSNVAIGLIYLYSKNVWAAHHFIFLLTPILILLMLWANTSRTSYWLVIFLLLLNLGGNIALALNSPVIWHASRSREIIFKYLSRPEIATKSVINFSSMGGYSIQALYGDKNQVVVWTSLKAPNSGLNLQEILSKSGREVLLNVCNSHDLCSYEALQKEFPTQEISRVGPDYTSWWIWEIKP